MLDALHLVSPFVSARCCRRPPHALDERRIHVLPTGCPELALAVLHFSQLQKQSCLISHHLLSGRRFFFHITNSAF
jgi:hypothetical protein